MSVFAYEPLLQMAFADDPAFPANVEEAEKKAKPDSGVVTIDEWHTYYARFYTDEVPPVIANSHYVVKKIHPGLLELNFRNYVGLSRIGTLNLEVLNKKISNELYRSMLDELTKHYVNLVFSFGTPVGQHYDKSTIGRDSLFVEYLFLKKYLLDQTPDIEAVGNILVYDPHRRFIEELQSCTIEQCQNVGEKVLHSLLSNSMVPLASSHPLLQSSLGRALYSATGKNVFPTGGIREVKTLTVDTNENRFVKFFLKELLSRIEELEGTLCLRGGSYLNPDIGQNLFILQNKIARVLDHGMWQEVGSMRLVPVSSQVLQRKEGYRQLFHLFSLLQLAASCDFLKTDFQNLIEIKDLPTLYEYWCFFQVKTVMDSLATPCKVSRFINESPLGDELPPGLCLEYDNGARLLFNKTYSGSPGFFDLTGTPAPHVPKGDSYSLNYRPDIVIEQGVKKLIFDAKYKGKRSGFYGEEEDGTVQVWKDEDLDKMHCYHDAINGVAGSFILYPGTRSRIFSSFGTALRCDGIGALAFRPEDDGKVMPSSRERVSSLVSDFLQSCTT